MAEPATAAPAAAPQQQQAPQAEQGEPTFVSAQAAKREAWEKEKADMRERYEREKQQGTKKREYVPNDDHKENPKDTRTFKVKVNGVEREIPEAEAIQLLQKDLAGDHKISEAQKLTTQAKAFINALRDDPMSVLLHPSLNLKERLDDLFTDYLYRNKVQPEIERALPAEEQQRLKEQRELEQYRKDKAESKRKADADALDELKERFRKDWSVKFKSAMTSHGVAVTDWTIGRMGQYMQQALDRGYKHIEPADVAPMVYQDWIQAARQMFGHLDADKFIEMFGDDFVHKLRKHDIAKFQKPQQQAAEQVDNSPPQRFNSVEEMVRAQTARFGRR